MPVQRPTARTTALLGALAFIIAAIGCGILGSTGNPQHPTDAPASVGTVRDPVPNDVSPSDGSAPGEQPREFDCDWCDQNAQTEEPQDRTPGEKPDPWSMVDRGPFAKDSASSPGRTCVISTARTVYCWGKGPLGDGTTESRETPTRVVGLQSGVQEISAGLDHTCALTNTGAVFCWGSNRMGQIGDGTTEDRLVPTRVQGIISGAISLAAHGDRTCVATAARNVKCWGLWMPASGSLTPSHRFTTVPTQVPGLNGDFIRVNGACAATHSGHLECW